MQRALRRAISYSLACVFEVGIWKLKFWSALDKAKIMPQKWQNGLPGPGVELSVRKRDTRTDGQTDK